MVSLTHLSIIGVGVLIVFVISIIIDEIDNANKIWVTRHLSLCDSSKPQYEYWAQINLKKNTTEIIMNPDPMTEYLQNKGVTVFDSKIEFKKDLLEILCEGVGCGCSSGIIASFLISEKDTPEFHRILNLV